MEKYLGDGLYARDDGFMVTLRAPRENGDHYVSLEPEVLQEFLSFLARSRSLEIDIKKGGKLRLAFGGEEI